VLGSFAGTVTSNVPGVSLSGAFTVQINTRNPANRFVRVSGTNVNLTVAGQTLSGDFMIEQTTTAAGGTVVGIAVDKLTLTLGDGTNTYLSVTNGEGYFLLTPTGIAASATASVNVTVPGVTLTGGVVKVRINTTEQPVASNFLIGDNAPSQLVLLPGRSSRWK